MIERYLVFLPFALIGVWRWGVWFLKLFFARRYTPVEGDVPEVSTSAVTPVYDEDPDEFMAAVRSWVDSGVDEVIAVIDHSDEEAIRRFREYTEEFEGARLVVTETPGKRPALRDGVKAAVNDVLILIDSDVRWRTDTLRELLKPFTDEDIGGVSPNQVVYERNTLAQVLYECQMRLQYQIDYPALSHLGRALSCLSGRTAAYRREALLPVIDDLCHETFAGKRVISGDDKFLTRAVQRNGWDVWYQSTAVVDIGAAASMSVLINQTIRWTRNTIRSDIMSFVEGWVFRKEWLAYYQIDRFIATFAILLAPLYFVYSVSNAYAIAALLILTWWMISRAMKIHPFLSWYPRYFWVVPLYTFASFLMSPVRLYALFSANTQGWLTRGDDGRYGLHGVKRRAVTYGSALLTVITLVGFCYVALNVRYY